MPTDHNISVIPVASREKKHTANRSVYAWEDALARGASIINAAVIQLFEHDEAFIDFATIFTQIREQDREQQHTPILLNKLIERIYFEGNAQQRKELITKLSLLEENWLRYYQFIDDNWQANSDEHNIETASHAAADLVSLLIKLHPDNSRKALFAAELKALQLIGRNELRSSPEAEHTITPINHLDSFQINRERREIFPFLSKLTKDDQTALISQVKPCYQRSGSLANLLIDKHVRNNPLTAGKKHISTTIHHASFSPTQIKDAAHRKAQTRLNIQQWLHHVARTYYDNLSSDKKQDNEYEIPIGTCSLLSALNSIANIFDSHKQFQQIEEIIQAIEQINKEQPIKLKFVAEGSELLEKTFKFDINLMIFGVNASRALRHRLIDETNKKNYRQFCDRVHKFLNLDTDGVNKQIRAFLVNREVVVDEIADLKRKDDLKAAVKALYLTFCWCFENNDFSVDYNYDLPTLYALINDLIGVQYDVWCDDSKDRTARIKMRIDAYWEHLKKQCYFPCTLAKNDRQQLETLEVQVYSYSLYRWLPGQNTPGLGTHMRLYSEQNTAAWFASRAFFYWGDLSDGNKHLPEHKITIGCKVSSEMPKACYEKALSFKNLFLKPRIFWQGVWNKITRNVTPYLRKEEVRPADMLTKQRLPNIRQKVKLTSIPEDLQKILNITKTEQAETSLSYRQVMQLRQLKLLDGVDAEGNLIATEESKKHIRETWTQMQILMDLNKKIQHRQTTNTKQPIKFTDAERDFLNDNNLHKNFELLFNLNKQPQLVDDIIENRTAYDKWLADYTKSQDNKWLLRCSKQLASPSQSTDVFNGTSFRELMTPNANNCQV